VSEEDEPYGASQLLDVTVDTAWQILTSVAGARRWFEDDSHPGVRVGSTVAIRGAKPAEIDAVFRGSSIRLSFPEGRRARLKWCDFGERCKIVVTDYGGDGREANALADGWSALLSAALFVINETKANRHSRQAIVVIHGIGSQRPLSTVKRFTDALVDRSERWSKPDQLSTSYELRRYQLRRTRTRPRTDLFELYWADKVPGTKLKHISSWLRSIARRSPRDVGTSLRPIAYLIWIVAVTAAIGVAFLVWALGVDGVDRLWHAASAIAKIGWISAITSVVSAAISGFLISSLGDAARYLDAAPDNIAVRQSIRQSGVSLLRRLHADRRYDRVVVVGHSLGSVIAYDIIRQYWSEVYRSHGAPLAVDQTCLKQHTELFAAAATNGQNLDSYRRAQRELWQEYRRLGHPWLITDIITVGSPLTHAETLLARSPDDFRGLKEELELPTCPPQIREDSDDAEKKSLTLNEQYLVDGQIRTIRMLTHACPFALTRWTNIFVPTKAIVFGDPIGGPIAHLFGNGIKDVRVEMSPWWRRYTPMAHTSYWHRPPGAAGTIAISCLIDALDIESGRWLDKHVSEMMPWEMSVGNRRTAELR